MSTFIQRMQVCFSISIFDSIKKSSLTDPCIAFPFEVKDVSIVFKAENVSLSLYVLT